MITTAFAPFHGMKPGKPLPFFHPTRVVFVDDDRAFLNLLPLRLPANLPFLRFDSPRELLSELEKGRLQGALDLDWWDAYASEGLDQGTEQVVAFDRSMIFLRVFNRARFGLISVLVVDYQMPEMSGLDLCRRLAHLPCKKILLTGQADTALAVNAFNEGLIDMYLPKLHPDLDRELNLAIQRLQYAYLEQATGLITTVLSAVDPTLWGDPAFSRFLHQICDDRGIVEYYAIDEPKGYLLVDPDGRAELLLLYDDDELDAQAAAAEASRAPEAIVRKVRARSDALHFSNDDPARVLSADQWWAACVPLHAVPGRDDRFYALVEQSESFLVGPETVLGLTRYLNFRD